MVALALQIAALVLFILAAISVPTGRYNLTAAGLACLTLSVLIGKL